MNSYSHNADTCNLATNQGSAAQLPKQHTRLALFAIIATLFITTLTTSGCIGLTSAGAPAKTTSNGATPGVLAASTTSLVFGAVAPGSKSSQTLILTNTGTTGVMITQATVFGSGFSVAGTMSSISIAPGKNQAFKIQFAPQASGSSNGSLVVASDASDSSLTLSLSGSAVVGPSITTQPASQSVTAGQTATFDVIATGSGALTYQWRWNGSPISGATSGTYTTPATTVSESGALLTVVLTDTAGTITSNPASLTVTATAVAPSISTQPASQTVRSGQTATFTLAATGTAPLAYQWEKNGTIISGAISASYTTPTTTASDSGSSFTASVSNGKGALISDGAILTVNVPPTITAQPVSQSVTVGQSANFAVAASGTPPLTYQWKKNGIAIGGANSTSYTAPATTISDNGASFSVTVSNTVGSITGNAATLTVNAATSLLNYSATSLSFSSVNIGGNSSLGVTFTNVGNSDVTISSVSIGGAGFAASGISTGQILTPGQTASLNVTFTPAGAGSVTGSVTVASNVTNSPATITLSGTGVQAVSHSATLSWVASTSSVAGYNVYRSAVSGGSYSKVNSQLLTSNQYPDSTVLAGQTYFYVVTSQDSSGVESTFSNEASAITPTP